MGFFGVFWGFLVLFFGFWCVFFFWGDSGGFLVAFWFCLGVDSGVVVFVVFLCVFLPFGHEIRCIYIHRYLLK